MNQIEVMKQALAFLEAGNFVYPTVIATDLRQAIEQAEQRRSFAEAHPANPDAKCKCEHWQSCPDCHPTATAQPKYPCQLTDAELADPEYMRSYIEAMNQDYAELLKHKITPTAPAQQSLTDEQILEIIPRGMIDCLLDPWDLGIGDRDDSRSIKQDIVRIARAIEAAHGIKGASL